MLRLIGRNLKLFFRDKANVIFSMFAVMIALVLYFLFLGEMLANGIAHGAPETANDARLAVAGLLMGGSVAIAAITASLCAMGQQIDDKKGALKDLTVSPLPQSKITLSYILSTTIISLIMTTLMLVIVMVYLSIRGIGFIGMDGIAKLALTTVLSVLCANAVAYFCILFIKSQAAFTALNSVIGAGAGFVMGVYIFIGMMPAAVQWVVKLFPFSHSASMYRILLADSALAQVYYANEQLREAYTLEEIRYMYGIVFSYGGASSGFWVSAAVLAVTTVVFFGLSLFVLKMRKRKVI